MKRKRIHCSWGGVKQFRIKWTFQKVWCDSWCSRAFCWILLADLCGQNQWVWLLQRRKRGGSDNHKIESLFRTFENVDVVIYASFDIQQDEEKASVKVVFRYVRESFARSNERNEANCELSCKFRASGIRGPLHCLELSFFWRPGLCFTKKWIWFWMTMGSARSCQNS